MTTDLRGLDLAEAFYRDVVEDLVGVPHAAALLGEGSEVLGYDTERSRDHEWGPRAQVLVDEHDLELVRERIDHGLPETYRGLPTAWYSLTAGGVAHHVEVTTFDRWIVAQLGFDPRPAPTTAQWLGTPQQRLLHVTAGRVFRDDVGELTRTRALLAWYPDDVWRWMIMSSWHQIGTVQPLRERCLEVDDELGVRLLGARLIRLIMDLAFFCERRYHPYEKWFGTAFTHLAVAPVLAPLLERAATAADQSEVGGALNQALTELVRRQAALELTAAVEPRVGPFAVKVDDAVRPYAVINTDDLIGACRDAISDPGLRATIPVGSIDQLALGDDAVVTFSSWPRELTAVYAREVAAEDG